MTDTERGLVETEMQTKGDAEQRQIVYENGLEHSIRIVSEGDPPAKDIDGVSPQSESYDRRNKVYDFLMKVGPDWDLAEKHGKANMCIDSSKTVLDLNDPDSFCPCCQMPYASDSDFFSIMEPCDNLGELGDGFPVFFYLVQYLTILLFVVSVVFFVPTSIFIFETYERVKLKMTD